MTASGTNDVERVTALSRVTGREDPTETLEREELLSRIGSVAIHPGQKRLGFQEIKLPNWSLKAEFLGFLRESFELDCFIETGTFFGNTTHEASTVFAGIHTVEASRELYEKAEQRFRSFPNVHVYWGDSSKELPTILALNKGRSLLLWLDAHFAEWVTEKVGKNTPILEEISAVRTPSFKETCILIDDLRCFQDYAGSDPDSAAFRGYPTIGRLCDALLGVDGTFKLVVLGDILLAYHERPDFGISPVLRACTVSRLYDGSNIAFDVVMEAERIIGEAGEDEIDAIQKLAGSLLCSVATRLGGHYRLWFGLTLRAHGRYDEACMEFLAAAQSGCGHWRVNWYVGQCAYLAGNLALARLALEAVVEAAPDFTEAAALLLEVYGARGLMENREGELSPIAHLALVEWFQEASNFTEAVREMEKILSGGTVDCRLLYRYAQLLIKTHQFDRSIGELEKVLSLDPRHSMAYNDLGVVFRQKGLVDAAVSAFVRAVSTDNHNFGALRNLFGLLIQENRRDEAVAVAQMLLKHHAMDKALENVVKEFCLPVPAERQSPMRPEFGPSVAD